MVNKYVVLAVADLFTDHCTCQVLGKQICCALCRQNRTVLLETCCLDIAKFVVLITLVLPLSQVERILRAVEAAVIAV